jgi:hypothetical protein
MLLPKLDLMFEEYLLSHGIEEFDNETDLGYANGD